MKRRLFALLCLGSCLLIDARGADPWDEPVLSGIWHSAGTMISEYEFSWAPGWKKEKRSPTALDISFNVMAEASLATVEVALTEHPNPPILEECLLFFGTMVPPEFARIWRTRIQAMAGLDQTVTKKVNEKLKGKGLPILEERALEPK